MEKITAEEARKNTQLLLSKLPTEKLLEKVYKRIGGRAVPFEYFSSEDAEEELSGVEQYAVTLACVSALEQDGYTVTPVYGVHKYKVSW
jgi:hypothetical protein